MCAQALMAAVLGGKSASVRELLARGADPEVPNREGMTPLQAAAFQNQRDVIEALIEGGAVVEVSRHDRLSTTSRCCHYVRSRTFGTGLEHNSADCVDQSNRNTPRLRAGRNLVLTVTVCCTGQHGARERLQSTLWSTY
jgi:ankyrin repeat protein